MLPQIFEKIQDVRSVDVAITAAEVLAVAAILRTVVIPALKAIPGWSKLPKPYRVVIVALLSTVAVTLENLATGKPPLLSVLMAVAATAASMGVHGSDKKRAELKAKGES